MSAPAPLRGNVPPEADALPASPVFPTSWLCHGPGKPPPPVAAVENHQTGPETLPPPDTAVTLQKYLEPGLRVPGEYDGAPSPVATCGGGFVVPKKTLYVMPMPPPVQLRVGDVTTPLAPLAGMGLA